MNGIGKNGVPTTLLGTVLLDEIQGINQNYQGKGHRRKSLNKREFIAWDGEGISHKSYRVPGPISSNVFPTILELHGENSPEVQRMRKEWDFEQPIPQPYVLLANSKGDYITRKEGLHTTECFELILDTKQRYPNSIFIGFGFGYDINQMIADFPERKLRYLHKHKKAYYNDNTVQWLPKRSIIITHRPTKRSATIDDVFGFFAKSFIEVCIEFLGKDDPDLSIIRQGKAARNVFTWEELDDFIIPYNAAELRMLVKIMDKVRESFHYIGLDLPRWYGPGVVAATLFKKHNIKAHMESAPEDLVEIFQYAYAGGRFEQFKLGRHPNTIYEYDIRSAYPAATLQLPSLSSGAWEYTETFQPGSFGVWHISYSAPDTTDRPQPLYCRAKDGSVSFPRQTEGWYWTPEAELVPDSVEHGLVWNPTSSEKPFEFVRGMYAQRQSYKAQGNPAQYPVKVSLNSIYGKMAQREGYDKTKIPTYHQLEWAGYITSYTRAALYRAILLRPDSIIACETDAVFSTEPLPLDIGTDIGQWELTTFKEITYLQSGFYYAIREDGTVVCKYRGMDADRETLQPSGLPFGLVLDHLSVDRRPIQWRTPPLHTTTTRFIGLGLALQGSSVFRSWETNRRRVSLDQDAGRSKRYHLGQECPCCFAGNTLSSCLHPMRIGGYSGPSQKHPLPWIDDLLDDHLDYFLEMTEADRWQ